MIYIKSSLLSAVFICLAFSWYVAGEPGKLMFLYFLIFLIYIIPFNALLVYVFGALAIKINFIFGVFLFVILRIVVGYVFYLIIFNKNSIMYSSENSELIEFYCLFGGAIGLVSFLMLRMMKAYKMRNSSIENPS